MISDEVERAGPIDVRTAISMRRSIKGFTNREVTRGQVEELLEVAALAPNHRMTQPWRFYVPGPIARRAHGAVLGGRKAKKVEDPDAARQVIERVALGHEQLPALGHESTLRDESGGRP